MSEPVLLDCLGEFCPMPIIHLDELIAESEPGTRIRVLSDDEGSKVDIPVWCRMKGHEFLGRSEHAPRGWAFELRVSLG
jgi:tRNA 2-thiouridine synthesizing protein A